MARQVFKAFVSVGLVALLSAALFGGFLTTCRFEWLQLVAREIQAASRDVGTQWMVVVCLLSYFVTFLILERRILPQSGTEGVSGANGKPSTPHPGPLPGRGGEGSVLARFACFRCQVANPGSWLVAFLLLVLARYALDYTNAARSLQVVVLLTGIVLGKGVALWVAWGSIRGKHSTLNSQRPTPNTTTTPSSILNLPSSSRPHAILSILTLLLAAAALWQPDLGMEFYYRGIPRWEGLWDNPNTYGLLMAVGMVLALGLLVQNLTSKVHRLGTRDESREPAEVGRVTPCALEREGEIGERPTFNFQPSTLNYVLRALLLIAVALCAFGLLKSYSRGAWLGTGVALTWLVGYFVWCLESAGNGAHGVARPTFLHRCVSRVRRNWFPAFILLLSIVVICFWQFRYTESPLIRRAFSVGNVNDFSWRNRVTAWQGAGRMMLDKPVLGFGWGKAEEVYRKDYRAERLEETAAIQLNDYLMLATSAGVPALICLVIYVSLAGYQVSRARRHRLPEPTTLNQPLATTAAAGALVLLIGFWFDGGLFKLPACVVFWVLLELARRSPHPAFGHPLPTRWGEGRGEGPQRTPPSRLPIALRWLAGIAAALAIGQTVLHLGTPQLAVSERTLPVARSYLVSPREKTDFEFLTAKPIWPGKPLKTLLQHAHLANYNRELVNWKLDDSIYEQFVLSPEIDPAFDGGMDWRRPLWEYFYPRIRKENSLEAAAEIVTRELRKRVELPETNVLPETIAGSWQRGKTSAPGLEVLGVAALRSVGIPARLSATGKAEFWNGEVWKPWTASAPPAVR